MDLETKKLKWKKINAKTALYRIINMYGIKQIMLVTCGFLFLCKMEGIVLWVQNFFCYKLDSINKGPWMMHCTCFETLFNNFTFHTFCFIDSSLTFSSKLLALICLGFLLILCLLYWSSEEHHHARVSICQPLLSICERGATAALQSLPRDSDG